MSRTLTIKSNRPRSFRRVETRNGTEFGIDVTPRDRQRLTTLARWYSLRPAHIARSELDPALWLDGPTPEYMSRLHAVDVRLGKLSRIKPAHGNKAGPLVGRKRLDDETAYWMTPYGQTVADTPWPGRNDISYDRLKHDWFAADIGIHIEAATRTRVLSQRELLSGTTHDWHDLFAPGRSETRDKSARSATRFTSVYESREGRRLVKDPDLVIPSPVHDRYIAVEVEHARSRHLTAYTEKLKAYRDNHHVSAIWFICSNATTADRVGAAAEEVFGQESSFPLRLREADVDYDGRYRVPDLTRDANLVHDLHRLQKPRTATPVP